MLFKNSGGQKILWDILGPNYIVVAYVYEFHHNHNDAIKATVGVVGIGTGMTAATAKGTPGAMSPSGEGIYSSTPGKPLVWTPKGVSDPSIGMGSSRGARTMPANLREQELLYEVWSTPSDGKAGIVPMTDKRWPAADGWLKMSRYEDGVEIH